MTPSQPNESAKTVWTVPRQHAALTAFKATGVAVSSALCVTLFVRIVVAVASGASAWLVLPPCLLGYLFADLVSGTAHWFCDTFLEEDTPVIGKIVIQPFRDHHVHPQRITYYRFIRAGHDELPSHAATARSGVLAGGAAAGERRRAPLVLRATGTGHGLVRHQSVSQVGARATAAGRGFCVTSGWMNPLLDGLRFFPRVEFVVRFFQR